MEQANIWNQLLIWPIVNVLVALYKFFEANHVPGALGFAVIALTILIRIILYPLMQAQLKSAKKMANLKPHLDELNAKHKDDKATLQQAQMALYKEHGINPAAGCLPLLVQMPVLIALYNVFLQVLNAPNLQTVVATINKVVYSPSLKLTGLDMNFFGVNLGWKPSEFQSHGYLLLLVPLITAALQYWQTKLMMPATPGASSEKLKVKSEKVGSKKEIVKAGEKPEEKKPDMAADMQKQMAIITPLMFGYFAWQFPLGLALYWNVFGLFGIMQQLLVNRANPTATRK